MNPIRTPDQIFGELFRAVQNSHVFADCKTFADATPIAEPEAIIRLFLEQRNQAGFNLKAFVYEHFILPEPFEVSELADEVTDKRLPIREHLDRLWDLLSREGDVDVEPYSSRLPLPQPYLVPGGRFRELYYWDSYFPMLGLAATGRTEMIDYMVANFADLIDRIGFIPNANRSYFSSRSQPPLFPMMVELLADVHNDEQLLVRYLPQMEKEYDFWMAGADQLADDHAVSRRVIRVGDGFLNRYWDDSDSPRPESYAEDLALATGCQRDSAGLFRDLRAACESGWDFSSRWLKDPKDLASVYTSEIVPVDLNAILYKFECVLARSASLCASPRQCFYQQRAAQRKHLLQSLFFDSRQGFFVDLILPELKPGSSLSLAGAYPMFFSVATDDQARAVAASLQTEFLRSGGWVTTSNQSGQQWDAPNGWAPLQWIVYVGLGNYGFQSQAREGAQRWVDNNLAVYRNTGCLFEKYDVESTGRLAGGGEYHVQTGFGWTNGVLLKLLDELGQ